MILSGFLSKWRDATPYLLFCTFCFAWGDVLFGLDTGSFGSLEALPSFLKQFGHDGKLSTWQKSVMNSSTYRWDYHFLIRLFFALYLELYNRPVNLTYD